MSYAHTKRRKNIARLKREKPHNWQVRFQAIADAVRKEQDGDFIGSLEDLLKSNGVGAPALLP